MSRKTKRMLRIILIVMAVLIIGSLSVATAYYYKQVSTAEQERDASVDQVKRNTKTAWIALRNIKAGEELIAGENVQMQQVLTGLNTELFWESSNEVVSMAKVDIDSQTPIFTTMTVNEIPAVDERLREISVVTPITTLEDYDYVDIRIAYATGDDYVVLSKKQVTNLSLTNCIWTTYMNENEILSLTSAMLDAYTIKGTTLYMTAYKEPDLQEAAVVTYPVLDATRALLDSGKNENIKNTLSQVELDLNKQARKQLLSNLNELPEETKSDASNLWDEIQSDFSTEYTKKELDELEYGY